MSAPAANPNQVSLTLYQASAGSGKTFNLVKEFVLLLFLNYYAPYSDIGERTLQERDLSKKYPGAFDFRSILGVTFTNKATIELKQRILKELNELANANGSKHFPAISKEVLKELTGLTDLDAGKLTGEMPLLAKRAVKEILEDYSHFQVRTIDSFFQEVLSSFRREIAGEGLTPTYRIELEVSQAIDLAIDRLKLVMTTKEYGATSEVVREQLLDSIGAEKWEDPFREIATIAKRMITSDDFDRIEPQLESCTFERYEEVRKRIDALAKPIEAKIDAVVKAAKALAEVKAYGFKSITDQLEKREDVIKSITTKAITADGLEAKEPKRKVPETFAPAKERLVDSLRTLEALPEEDLVLYRTILLVRPYLIYTPTLSEVLRAVREYERENHLLLIPKVNQLIDRLIDDTDAPFIYDRIGVRLSHYMIDEFQDTSKLQWSNFRPLINEARASGHENFLVGDAKQSIYRFRGAASSGFIELANEVERNSDGQSRLIQLPMNWRSDGRIIDFNNAFFSDIYDYAGFFDSKLQPPMADLHRAVYERKNVEQDYPKEKADRGCVSVTQIEDKFFTASNYDEEGSIKRRIRALLDRLLDRGYRRGNIALLVRTNKEVTTLAEWLSEWSGEPGMTGRYDFISDEALKLTRSYTVQLLRYFVRAVARPSDSHRTVLSMMIRRYVATQQSGETDTESRVREITEGMLRLPIYGRTIYELILRVVELLEPIPREERIFVNAFIDLAYHFLRRSPDLSMGRFDEWLELRLGLCAVEMGDSSPDRIRLMTIHKAKGLEFPVVVMPFATWEVATKETKTNLRLLDLPEALLPETEPRSAFPCFVNMTQWTNGLNSLFADAFEEEREGEYMDSLNLLYVAFTRAKSELHLFTTADPSESNLTVAEIIRSRKGFFPKGEWNEEDYHSTGNLPMVETEEKPAESRPAPIRRLAHFVDLSDLKLVDKYSDEETDFGVMMHELFASVIVPEDLEPQLLHLRRQARISDEEADLILCNFHTAVSAGPAGQWFPPRGTAAIRTEATITEGEAERRPDRIVMSLDGQSAVVIDYKFGHPTDRIPECYRKQVRRYAEALCRSGIRMVEGYLWYLRDPNGIIKIL